jgi:biotin synthase-related radical SAM superfamily protein
MGKVTVSVNPGICGFECKVNATRKSKKTATIEIIGSECKMINNLAANLSDITVDDLFKPHTKNLIFKCTEKAHCHLCCPVPIAIIKAAEVSLELALPNNVLIDFD